MRKALRLSVICCFAALISSSSLFLTGCGADTNITESGTTPASNTVAVEKDAPAAAANAPQPTPVTNSQSRSSTSSKPKHKIGKIRAIDDQSPEAPERTRQEGG